MGRAKTAKVFLPAALLLLAGVCVFAAGWLKVQRVFPLEDCLHFGGQEKRVSLSSGDSYGMLAVDGPYLNLPAGTYQLTWQVESDGENTLVLTNTNGTPISPERIPLVPGEAGNCSVRIMGGCRQLQIAIEFDSGSYLKVNSLRLISPAYTDNAVTLLLLLSGIALCWVLHGLGHLNRKRAGLLVLVGVAVLIASTPALKQTLTVGHDTHYHLARLENLVSSLRSGQFPARMGGYSYNGFGAITSVFYPDLFLYPFAVLRMLGASPTYTMNLYMVTMQLLSALTMAHCARMIFGNHWMAACAAILYTLASYRITNAYTRCALGELTAMTMIPIFLLGLFETVCGDKRRYLTLTLGAAGVFLSHMLSTLICGVTAVIFCLAHAVRIVREGRVLPLLKAALLTLLLCAFQLVPMLTYSMQGIGAGNMAMDMGSTALEPAQLLLMGTGTMLTPKDGHLTSFTVEIGFALLLCAALAVCHVLSHGERGVQARTAMRCTGAGLLFAVCCTRLFPWSQGAVLTGGLSSYLQFSWRLLTMAVPLLALAGGYGVVRMAGSHPDIGAMLVLALSALCVLPMLSQQTAGGQMAFGEISSSNLDQMEYTLPDTQYEWTLDHAVYVDGEAVLTDVQKAETQFSAQIDAKSSTQISLPLFGFDGFLAEVDGQRMDVCLGENNRLTVSIPANTQGTLRAWFAEKAYWRVADGISLLTLLLLCLRRWRQRRAANRAR